jgi:hypothetical protein
MSSRQQTNRPTDIKKPMKETGARRAESGVEE